MIHVKTLVEDFPHLVHKARKIWCIETFGKSFGGKPAPGKNSETKWVDCRWSQYNTYFRFKYEEDAMIFILRWGGEIRNKVKWKVEE